MKRQTVRLNENIERILEEGQIYKLKPGKDLVWLFHRYLKPVAGSIFLALFFTIVWSAQPFGFSLAGRYLVDQVLQLKIAESVDIDIAHQMPLFWRWMLAMGIIWAVFLISHWFRNWLMVGAGKLVAGGLRRDLHEKLQDLHLGYFEAHPTGRLVSRVLSDVKMIRQWVSVSSVNLMGHFTRLALGLGVLFYLNARLAMIVLAVLPLYAAVFYFFRPRIRRTNIAFRRLNSSMYALSAERISGIQVAKCFGHERGEVREFVKRVSLGLRMQMRLVRYHHGLVSIAGVIVAAITGVMIYMAVLQVKNGLMTLGSALAFINALTPLFRPVNFLTTELTMLQAVFVVIRRVLAIIEEDIEVKPGKIQLDGMTGKIFLDDVTFTYPEQKEPALRNTDLEIDAGERVAIMGPSGAGKTTLFMLLLRFYDPQEGAVRVGGVNLVDADPRSVKRHVCMVQQEPVIFSGTLADNVTYGRLDASAAEIRRATQQAELHNFIMTLPDKYETAVGERGVTLSGGQKQRLSLATALLTDPEVLLLDDTTSALDSKTEARIRTTLNKVLEGRTSLIITQRVATAMECDRIIVFENGSITQQGTHGTLSVEPGFYRRVCEQQSVFVDA